MNKLILALIASAAAISSAHADTPYVGIGVGTARYSNNVALASSTDSDSGYKVLGKLFYGHELNATWGAEAGYINLGSTTYNYTLDAKPGSLHTEGHAYYLATKASTTLNECVLAFVKLGISRHSYSQTGTGVASGLNQLKNANDLYVSLGAQYKLNKEIGLTVELEHYGNNNQNGVHATVVTAGLRYSF